MLFRDAAAKLYEETRAADVVFGTDMTPGPAVCLDYHARQLVRYARYGEATFYGKKMPSTVMEPICRNDLRAGKCADGMNSWIAENGIEYADLSLRHHDLRRVIRLVKQAVKEHDALLVWCRQHTSSHSS